jgi:hypothetical protein
MTTKLDSYEMDGGHVGSEFRYEHTTKEFMGIDGQTKIGFFTHSTTIGQSIQDISYRPIGEI